MLASIHKTNEFDFFTGNVCFGLGVRNTIPFWVGRWLGGTLFKKLFPLLYNLSSKPMGCVNEMGNRQWQRWSWDFHIAAEKLLDNPLAVQEALEPVDILGSINPLEDDEDTIRWLPNVDGVFSVKRCSSFLREQQLEVMVESNTLAAINRFWGTEVP